ncbi:uncharacterized protein LOC129806812 [Phlebotomus papatasi]|uniref:uncharacterized protein LOC129806812 n=1 Tax=Phlebotomus papatasi TaxID=29031 RepID=UPI0024845006|nr:uncharacterized protein LOC129806812 [Phlebotomus papatasi]
MAEQCDIDAKTRERLLDRQKFRMTMREEFIKQLTNPHRVQGGGTVFDQGLQRFQAARVTQYDHFKPNFKTARKGFFVVLFPIVAYAYMLKKERSGREHLYRTGQVSYRDRKFKFI